MISRLFNNSTIPVLQQVVSFTQARQGVLAGNMANMNVPGYKTRDLSVESFQQALKQQIAAQREGDFQSPGHPVSPMQAADKKVKESLNNIVYHDGTNIDIEKQTVEANKNQYMHNLAIAIMTNQFALLQTAINERA
jgi:flagellar basal-body rod protein FlgB